jgi:hypothetical protein
MSIHRIGADVTVLNDQVEVPGIGFLPVNAFVLHAAQPVVVDTGLTVPAQRFLDVLGSVVDPKDVRWIWLTHPDRDHTGGIFDLLEAAPNARLITTFLGAGILSLQQVVPIERMYFLNPGESLDIGDRTITAFRPPLFDNPATVGFYDHRSDTCFSSDCFGAVMPSPELAAGDNAADVPAQDLRAAQLVWATIDSPWLDVVDPVKFHASVQPLREMNPGTVLSTHLPPVLGHTDGLFGLLDEAPHAAPFIGPNQEALEQLLASFDPEAS